MNLRKLPLYLGLLSILAIAFGAGYISYPLLHTAGGSNPLLAVQQGQPIPAQNMEVYWEAWRLLEQDFFGEKPSTSDRVYGAIRGMTESFHDPYTYFVEPQPRELERDELRGHFGGIGATIEPSDSGYLLHPMPDQPAEQAGIQDGDLLLLVDDTEITAELTIDDVVALVRGPVGTEVVLVVRRSGPAGDQSTEVTVQIIRAEIETPSVQWQLVENNEQIGYIQQTLFSERSPEEMQNAIQVLLEQGAESFILDLRGNPGGLVESAVAIADMWLDQGAILIEQRADGSESTREATEGNVAGNTPLVVIIDGGSASASEILAGALQDHHRAQLVGEKTYGKGSVQLIHELPDQSSLHITNAHWFTPNRNPISGHGLTPDILVASGSDPMPEAITAVQRAVVAQAQAKE